MSNEPTGANPTEGQAETTAEEVQIQDSELEYVEDVTKQKIGTLAAQKKHWAEKYQRDAIDPETGKPFKDLYAERVAAEKQKIAERIIADRGSVDKGVQQTVQETEERVELRVSGYSRDEVDEISRYAKANGFGLIEASEKPFIKAAIKAYRADKEAQAATMTPSSRTPSSGESSTKVSFEKLMAMTPEQRELHSRKSDAQRKGFAAWKASKRGNSSE